MSERVAKIGKYEIVQRIGTGGFGAVYEARDPFIKRPVAVKTCLVPEKADQARFFREAELAGSLQHRNITTVHDFGVHDGMPYLVEELLSGEDLDLVIRRGDSLSLSRKVEILIGIAYGLEHAHNAGIVHRDVKPSNVRLLEDGTVKIMDFGIASSLRPEPDSSEPAAAMGTSAYLAPERIRGHVSDRRADIFSFGVLAYELLASRKPFAGDTTAEILDGILRQEPPPLARFAPAIPSALAAVVSRALEKEPGRRYDSVSALREDLIAVRLALGDQPAPPAHAQLIAVVPESPSDAPTTPIRVLRSSRRTLPAAAVAALVSLAIAGGLVVFWPSRTPETPASAPLPARGAVAPLLRPASPLAVQVPQTSKPEPPASQSVPASAPPPESEPQSVARISRRAPVQSEGPKISLAAAGSASNRRDALRYIRAAEEPGLSRETRAHLYLRSALASHAAGDLRAARKTLRTAFALSPDLGVNARSYGPSFARVARQVRAEAP